MLSAKDAEFAANVSRTDREAFRFLQSLSDSGDTRILISKVQSSLDLFQRYSGTIPGIKELLDGYEQWREVATSNPSDAVRWHVMGASMTPEIQVVARAIRSAYRIVRRWGTEFVHTVQQLRSEGVIEPEIANPNRESKRYKVAVDTAGALSQYWFVKRVVLFGSVAKGTDTEGSDIDLLVEAVVSIARTGYAIERVAQEVKDQTGDQVNVTLKSDKMTRSTQVFFQKAGFFEASIVLFERKQWSFDCRGEIYNYSGDDFLDATYICERPLLLFKAGKKRAQAVLLDGDDSADAIGVIRGIMKFGPVQVGPRWVTTSPETDRILDLAIYQGLLEFRDRGHLVDMEPWLVYSHEA